MSMVNALSKVSNRKQKGVYLSRQTPFAVSELFAV